MAYTTIDDSSEHFQVETYTGAGANTAVTFSGNSNLKPDLLWIKNRGADYSHFVVDSNRNISYAQNSSNAPYLEADTDAAENNNNNWMSSVASDGFTTGISEHINSTASSTFVAWAWKANGGTTASNTSGSLNSTVQANTDAGFSIVSFTGNGTDGATVGHGLGAVPAMVIFKCRDTGNTDWRVYHQSISPTNAVSLSDAGAQYDASGIFGGTFTSTLLKVENDTGANRNTSPMIAYCFTDIQGYSKFGSYVGNGQAQDGPFVYLGFKPAFIMIKNSETANRNWYMFDNARRTFNPNGLKFNADTAGQEATDQAIDMLSNGFKVKPSALGSFGTSVLNHSGQKLIYMAFAENPLVTSTGIPTTAR
jgi:hypothetical protein